MKKAAEVATVDWNGPEAKKLFEAVRAKGYNDGDIKDIIEDAESPEEAHRDLREIVDWKPSPGLMPDAPRAPLAPHEEEIFERIISGECEPETIVG